MIPNLIMPIKTVQNWIVNGYLTGVRHLPGQVRHPADAIDLYNSISYLWPWFYGCITFYLLIYFFAGT